MNNTVYNNYIGLINFPSNITKCVSDAKNAILENYSNASKHLKLCSMDYDYTDYLTTLEDVTLPTTERSAITEMTDFSSIQETLSTTESGPITAPQSEEVETTSYTTQEIIIETTTDDFLNSTINIEIPTTTTSQPIIQQSTTFRKTSTTTREIPILLTSPAKELNWFEKAIKDITNFFSG